MNWNEFWFFFFFSAMLNEIETLYYEIFASELSDECPQKIKKTLRMGWCRGEFKERNNTTLCYFILQQPNEQQHQWHKKYIKYSSHSCISCHIVINGCRTNCLEKQKGSYGIKLYIGSVREARVNALYKQIEIQTFVILPSILNISSYFYLASGNSFYFVV